LVPRRSVSRLESLPGLQALARAHHGVVAAVAARTATLPLRLATVHSGDERLVETLRQGYRRFRDRLDHLAGRVEVGVKVYALAAPPAAPSTAATSANPGRVYLRQRRQQRHDRDDAWRRAVDAARRLDTLLGGLAADRRHYQPKGSHLSAAADGNILNAAYLVAADDVDEFAGRARHAGATAHAVRVEITGLCRPASCAAARTRRGG
jgi:hypothetical protein